MMIGVGCEIGLIISVYYNKSLRITVVIWKWKHGTFFFLLFVSQYFDFEIASVPRISPS